MFYPTTMKNLPPLCVLLAILVGCASPKPVMYDSTKREPTTAIDVFREGDKPTKSYKEIGEVSREDFGGEESKVVQELINSAKKEGATAIIFMPRKDTGYFLNLFGRSGNRYMWKAVAAVYQ
ncbi:MAG: hypothetical protein JWR26_2921 [Pedosphaera sp.]|nr:hypothetical protein [Pedosphaera sp.]